MKSRHLLAFAYLGHVEPRNEISYLRGAHRIASFRHDDNSFRTSAAIPKACRL